MNNYLAFAGSWYKGDVNKEVAEDIEDGYVPPNSDAYTINGQPGDFCPCSNGMWRHVYSWDKYFYYYYFLYNNKVVAFSICIKTRWDFNTEKPRII